MDNDSVPQGEIRPQLTIAPDGLETYHALRRGKQFVTLHYRKDKPVRLSTVEAWIGALLDDIARAGLLVGDITVILSHNPTTVTTSATPFTATAKMEVRPRVVVDAENAAWVDAMRARFARRR